MAGTRWVLGALLRGCGCNCSSCRQTGAAGLPFYSAAGTFPSGVSGRRRLLLFLGAAAAAASQTRRLQLGPAAAGRLAGPVPVRPSAAAAAAASYSTLRLLPRSLAAAAGPARGYSQVGGAARRPHARVRPSAACASRARPGIRGTHRTPASLPLRPPIGHGNKGRSPGPGSSCFVPCESGRLGSVSVAGVNVEALFPAGPMVGFGGSADAPHPAYPLALCPLEVKLRGRSPRRVGAGRACGGSGRPGGSGLLGRPPARIPARTGAWASLGTAPARPSRVRGERLAST